LPGGKSDPGENFERALSREVQEETGLKIRLLRPFETAFSDLPERQVIYLVMLTEVESGEVRLSKEHDKFQWIVPSQVDDFELAPQFRGVVRHYAQFVESQKPTPPSSSKPTAFITPEKLKSWLAEFRAAQPKYETLKTFLLDILEKKIKSQIPLANIGGRTKKFVSFADKLIRKNKYNDPLRELTDLAGLRIIVHLPSEVEIAGRIIRETFHIDEANSLDMLSRLGADRFGYRSVHYIVEILKDKPAGIKIPSSLIGLKAEIQVRTIAQHAWSDIGHDRLYKGACEISEYWKREANRVAALLEAADEEFQRLVEGISFYEAHRPRCLDIECTRHRIELTHIIHRYAPKEDSVDLILRLVRLSMEIEDWKEVIRVTNKVDISQKPILLALRGYAKCKLARNDAERQSAWEMMIKAAEMIPDTAEPRLLLAGCMEKHGKNIDAIKQYRKAFEAEPDNSAVISGYIRQKTILARDEDYITIARPAIQTAIRKCNELLAANADIPRNLYRIAGFLQQLGPEKEWECLATLALAVRETRLPDELVRALVNVDKLADREPHRQDIECARRFLAAAMIARFPETPFPKDVKYPAAKPLPKNGPFIIVAGGCDPYIQSNMRSYRKLLQAAFQDFKGNLISGGTKEGISGLVGEIAANSHGRINAIGYLPPQQPTDGTATPDKRYKHICHTDSKRFFSSAEAIQVWLDLLSTGVKPSDIRLLGINGGLIAGLEYRFALALGAKVAILQSSGREAERLIQEWPPKSIDNLLVIPPDPMAIRAFLYLGVGTSKILSLEKVTAAARQVHEDFLDQQRYRHSDPVMQPWAKLRPDLQKSNRSQIEYLENILNANGFAVREVDSSLPPNDPAFKAEEIERMAKMEHGRWVLERITSGWTYGPKKSAEQKISPYLVKWGELDDQVRDWDRKAVRIWPEILGKEGLEIYRLPKNKTADSKLRRKNKTR